jgi:molybdopterin-guanine dinucleotide biosynthesis protein MobB
MTRRRPILGFLGPSHSGKTTLLTRVIDLLSTSGLNLGAVKHHHRTFTIDHQGKDSQRFTAAGARKTIITGPQQTALIEQTPEQIPLEKLADFYMNDLDLILVEGFKQTPMPKIEVQRRELNLPLLSRNDCHHDPNLVAVVSDRNQELDVPLFEPEAVTEICRFILNYFNLKFTAAK